MDIQGEVHVRTSDGEARVMTNYPMLRPVTIINDAGDIAYRVRAESAGSLDFQALRGRVLHHVNLGELIVHPGTDHDTLLATFNGGQNPIVLRAADGEIRFASVERPTHVGLFIR